MSNERGNTMNTRELDMTAKETGLFLNNKEDLKKAIQVLTEAGLLFQVEEVSIAFAKSEARKIQYELENALCEENKTPKNKLTESDLSLIGSEVLSESVNIDCFLDELKVAVSNEMMFTNIYL